MRIIDSHCDLLSKMLQDPFVDFNQIQSDIAVNLPRLQQVDMAIQFFAIYISEKLDSSRFEPILESIDLFYQKIAANPAIAFIKSREDLEKSITDKKIGAILTLEGADGLGGSLRNLRIAYYLGVRCIGITWNYANWAADGVMETRNGGFSIKGQRFVKECNKLGILLDVSHLAEAGFWQLMELSQAPVLASHSNTFELCPHPRNLSNEQIKAIITKQGAIGLTFVPYFVKSNDPQISDLLRHIDHVCSLGGEDHLGFGSDFDGIETFIPHLEHVGQYDQLINELCKKYPADLVDKLVYRNWLNFLKNSLHPKSRC
ncbi:membrane dipeptidase [Paenibacillus psychroresistens]|uniref:Membrane dipeptidase n=1 Tax=Paenibacillus psychroresistens TaxID=1778678 RepID=A0A6B8RLL1_9BACL|nr:dipeptidase [Paenibacillus psychroresistens]QGQ96306.1 membrane dipeptidase [Paenibacillus psychroresistens]